MQNMLIDRCRAPTPRDERPADVMCACRRFMMRSHSAATRYSGVQRCARLKVRGGAACCAYSARDARRAARLRASVRCRAARAQALRAKRCRTTPARIYARCLHVISFFFFDAAAMMPDKMPCCCSFYYDAAIDAALISRCFSFSSLRFFLPLLLPPC